MDRGDFPPVLESDHTVMVCRGIRQLARTVTAPRASAPDEGGLYRCPLGFTANPSFHRIAARRPTLSFLRGPQIPRSPAAFLEPWRGLSRMLTAGKPSSKGLGCSKGPFATSRTISMISRTISPRALPVDSPRRNSTAKRISALASAAPEKSQPNSSDILCSGPITVLRSSQYARRLLITNCFPYASKLAILGSRKGWII
jgi:hypothetical protein